MSDQPAPKSNLTSARGLFALLLLAILLVAGWVRTYNIDWDEGTHLHPDERYLTMVVSAIEFPDSLAQYWNTGESPLNPVNKGYAGYVYGTLPLFATRVVAGWVDLACVNPPNPFGVLLRAVLLNASGPCYEGHYIGYSGIHFVGRALSALVDLATLVALTLLARALYGNKTALLAAALYAFTVLPIQHAHFFVVDSFATVFVAWTLCFAVWAVRYRRPWLLLPAGFATGLAVASKISVWPLAGIVGIAALLHCEPSDAGKLRYRFAFRPAPIVTVILSGMLAALAFRIAQPYAFTGPGFFGVRINPSWMNTMRDAQDMASGLRDAPFGHQWTARTPIIFPLRNMLFWGMGLPLGLAAWAGWGAMAWRLVRKREWQHLLIWVWGTIFFLYQATLWVKSMRYLLPVYPVFAVFGAWALVRGAKWAWGWSRPMLLWRKVARGALLLLPALVLAGTLVWALAFLQIYSRSLTRVEASRWMYDNIPTVATAHTVSGDTIQILVHPNTILSDHTPTSVIPFTSQHESVVTHIALNDVSAIAVGGNRRVRIALADDPYGETVLAETTAIFTLEAYEQQSVTVALPEPLFLKATQQVYLDVTLLEGEALRLQTSIIATMYTMEGIAIQIPVQPNTILSDYTPTSITPFVPEYNVAVTRITLNKVSAPEKIGNRRLRLALMTDPYETEVLVETTIDFSIFASGRHVVEASLPAPISLEAGQMAYLEITLLEGDTIRLQTSVIANEHWDDALPQRIDGKDAYGNWYRGLSSPFSQPDGLMHIYDNDIPEKRAALFDWLDEADYVALSSNRAYASIPRLPMRYPFTTAYYEALFDGSLGFELLAEFVSYPALGPCQFPDQEIPFDVPTPRYTNARPCQIPFPPAEEAFSVYDHPTVLIFAKTDAYSRARAETILPLSLLDDVRWMTPLQATRGREAKRLHEDSPRLLMTPDVRADQESGGTWSRLFNRNALHNRSQILAVIVWWFFLTVLGLIAFPWLYYAFPALRYRGYGLSRAVGLLAWSYIAWLLSSVRLLPHTPLLLWAVLIFGVALAGWFVYKRQDVFRTFFREHWRDLLRIELLFAVLYLGWTYVRFLNPDLWHPVSGGEKPMDFAYLNAVIKSTWFPPYDPWFAGGTMNYYYFGFVMVGSLIKVLGIVPSVGYNLAVPALFAMTGVGAYTIANNLGGGDRKRGHRAGVLGLLLVLVLGNLGELRLLFLGFQEIGGIDFDSLIPGYPAVVSAIVGFWEVLVKGKPLQFRSEWWYWNATRVIPVLEGEVGPINEFPAFTFLYADLHAHMMALPLTQVALAIALQWGLEAPAALGIDRAPASPKRTWRDHLQRCIPHPLPTVVLAGLIAGALRATNTWDWPTYLGLMSVAAWLTIFSQPEQKDSGVAGDAEVPGNTPGSIFPYYKLLTPVLFFLLGELLFLPFTANFEAAYSSFSLWRGSRTPFGIYLIMHGQFLFPLVVLAVVRSRTLLRRLWQQRDESTLLALGMVTLGMIVLGGALLIMGVSVAWVVIPLGMVAALLVVDPHSTPHTRQLWMWVGTALTLSLLVEIYVLDGDIGRMNTVFKFYLQVWMLLGLSAAVAAGRIIEYALRSYRAAKGSSLAGIPYFVSDAVSVVLAILLASAALYPALAIPAKTRDRWASDAPRTLDGMVYMRHAVQYESDTRLPLEADYRVIRWLQDNVQGSPTIIESPPPREYLWGGRISVYTGLPAVAAWRWHSVQQRMTMPGGIVEARQMDINYFYNTIDAEYAMTILERYDVQYVILAPYERAYMIPEGLPKFDEMTERGWLIPVYDDEYSTVYRVNK